MTPKQHKFIESTKEMERLYLKDQKTLQEIGDIFGLSRQAIHIRLTKKGVKMRKNTENRFIRLKREDLVENYVEKLLTITKTAENLGVSPTHVSRELERHNIEKRTYRVYRGKYKFLPDLEVGGKARVKIPKAVNPYSVLYTTAKRLGMKLSVRKFDEKNFDVTRVE